MKKEHRLSDGQIIRLAKEILVSTRQLKDIANDFGITPQKLSQIRNTKYFREVYERLESEYILTVSKEGGE